MSDFWQRPPHEGPDYYKLLGSLHAHLRPRTYLEIGTSDGRSLQHAACPSIAIDPAFKLKVEVLANKTACHFFRMPSDRFFAAHDPVALLGGPVDIAFLDGMHLYEFLLRDFMHVERHCRPNSVVLIHDCIPTDAHVARRRPDDLSLAGRSATPDWWAGDVWKAIAILQRYRPELRMHGYGAPPTGLVVVTGLNPGSTVLQDVYFEAVADMAEAGKEAFEDCMARLEISPGSRLERFEGVAERYWL